MLDEISQEFEFFWRQSNGVAAEPDAPGLKIYFQISVI